MSDHVIQQSRPPGRTEVPVLSLLTNPPVGWKAVPHYAVFRRVRRVGYEDLPLLSVYRDLGIVPREGRDDNHNRPSEDLSNYQRVNKGDLVINKMKAWQGSVGVSDYQGLVSPAYFVFEPVGRNHGRFLHHLLRSDVYTAAYGAISKGIRVDQWDLDPQEHSRLPVILPPIEVQRRIAAFLDHETARIDELVREQEQLNELLDEKHQATIKHVVENGLPGTVGSWKRAPFKYVARIRNGRDYKDVEEADGPYPVIGSGGEFARASKYLHDGESVLLGRKGTIDKPLYVKGRFWTVDTMFYTEVVPGNAPKFVYYVSTAFPFDALSTRTALPSMTQEALGAVRVRLPSLAEQHRIVEFLDAEAERVNQIRALQTKNIALLRERRSALISAAVTGQLDLRDWQPPESVGVAEVA